MRFNKYPLKRYDGFDSLREGLIDFGRLPETQEDVEEIVFNYFGGVPISALTRLVEKYGTILQGFRVIYKESVQEIKSTGDDK